MLSCAKYSCCFDLPSYPTPDLPGLGRLLSDDLFSRLLVFEPRVVISFMVHNGNLRKVLLQRRRLQLPFKAGGLPGIIARNRSILQGPRQIQERHHVADPENCRSGGRENIQDLELRRIGVVTARHSQIAKDELREERKIEADERDDRRQL